MSRVTGKPPTTRWRRPITRTYDYNMSLGENYYKPQLDYISSRKGRGKTPPSATTFAERLSKYPPSGRSSSSTRRAEEAEYSATSGSAALSSSRDESSLGRYASLDDLGLDEDFTSRRRRQLLLQASQENLSADRGASPLLSPGVGGGRSTRVTFGDAMLDAVGVKDRGSSITREHQKSSLSSSSRAQSSSVMTTEEGDAIDKILAERRNRRQAGIAQSIRSAEADLFTEDPFKSPQISNRLQNARRELNEMRDEMKSDADASTSRFRQKLRAKREREQREEQEQLYGSLSALNDSNSAVSSFKNSLSSTKNAFSSAKNATTSSSSSGIKLTNVSSSAQNLTSIVDDDDAETAAILNKVEEIRKRAKARLAQITDDFPELQIESSLASRRAAGRQAFLEDDFDSDVMPSSRLANSSGGSSASRSVAISKRTMKSSYDYE